VERRVDAGGTTYRVLAVEIPRDAEPGMALVVVDRVDERPGDALARSHLTPRECAVAMLIARGHSNGEISDTLGISAHTARHHTESVMRKLGVRSRTQVAARVLGAEALGALARV
jgi:DNA-binding CsgD family transcriptional regulator